MARLRFSGLNAVNMGVGIMLNISIPTKYKNAVQNLIDTFNSKNEYEIKPYKEKRSLSANSFCWVLLDRLAEKLHTTKEQLYKIAIGNVGVFTEVRVTDVEAAKRFKRIWHNNGIGWLTKTIDETTIHAYYGSSTYNTHEMARLIDFLVEECKAQGIETRPKEEIDSMLKEWGKEHG